MISREFYTVKTVPRQDAPPLMLYYYILASDTVPRVYGAEIVLQCDGAWRSACVSDITTSEERITQLLGRLAHHSVTPCTLEDIVLDSLNKY